MSDDFDTPFRGTERFQILRCLGVGGMGVVYEVLDRERSLRVALKTVRTFDAQSLLRFKKEFRALQGIEHPNLVTLFELHNDDNHWFFTMELVKGRSLTDWVRNTDEATKPRDSQVDTAPMWRDTTVPASALGKPLARGDFDEVRLRGALAQLASGLAELHRAGKVHRDIKPSNVLCTADGRVVLLDFGLIADTSAERLSESGVVGTVLYMAPEQAAGKRPGPEADWYAVGVMLYEILTGRLPFDGPSLQVLQDKQRTRPMPPSSLVACASDLEELCIALLDIDPKKRPSSEHILNRLGVTSAVRERSQPTSLSSGAVFVGRERELAELDAAFEETRRGNGVIVAVEGASGVGKSALVSHFVKHLVEREPDTVVLSGRYYEREAVPYRAFDGLMDALSRFLMHEPPAVADAMLPTDIGLLASLFPSLRGVESVSRTSWRPPALDPHELRVKLFAAVRELFLRISQRRPLVLVVDDVQWSDSDSRAIFAEGMRGPDEPPLLLLVTLRTNRDDPQYSTTTDRVLGYLRGIGQTRHIPLSPLGPTQARELAQRLLGRERGALAEAIAGESEGHPLFIDALVRHALLVGGETTRPTALRLDEALAATVDQLDDDARHVLELVALSFRPLVHEVARRAAGLEHAALPRVMTALRSVHLVRGARDRDEDAIEPYHDRIRELVHASLDDAQRRLRHEELARVLEARGERADPQELYTHWRQAGNTERALHYAALSAQKATDVLAFDRAARLYREAIGLAPDAETRRRFVIRLGEALAASGRGADAARAFIDAVAGAPADEALDLRRRASEQLLRCGQIDEGLAAVRGVLAEVQLSMPSTPNRALASFLWNRARLALRGLGFKERQPGEIANTDLMRIDVCWSVAGVLSMVDTIRGANFQAIHLRLALAAGEPSRVVRALAVETGYSATVGSPAAKRTAKIFNLATQLADRVATPYAIGMTRGCGGAAAGLEGRWRECYALTKEAEEIFRSQCGNIQWELSTFHFFHIYSLAYRGEMVELQQRVPRLLREAEDRGERYGQVTHRAALANMVWLCKDDVDEARHKVREIMREGHSGYHVEHFWALIAECQAALYADELDESHAQLEKAWPSLVGALLLRVQLSRIEAVHLRARMWLALAARDRDRHPQERDRRLAGVKKYARRLDGEGAAWAAPLGTLLDAGVAKVVGDPERAAALLEDAIRRLVEHDLHLYAAAARLRLGDLRSDVVLVHEAEAWMRQQRILSPRKMTAMLVPGF